MKVILQINGREMTFSEEQLIAILEKHFSIEQENNAAEEVVKNSIVGTCYEVKPSSINKDLFKEERKDPCQEEIRKLILEAFEELDRIRFQICKSFKIIVPEKTWTIKNVRELKALAIDLGGQTTNWIEQALGWAQQINDGATWEDLCNKKDKHVCYRLIIWKDGTCKNIGGSIKDSNHNSLTNISDKSYDEEDLAINTVPSITQYC